MSKEITEDFVPTQEQISTFARRLMPEIKRFFADEQIQREFAEWQEKKCRQVANPARMGAS